MNHPKGAVCKGSSPLARGLRDSSGDETVHGRIIPARAGFTGGCSTAPRRSPDHPRSRGVYMLLRAWVRWKPGSSPLARGLRFVPLARDTPRGIIPARAGFTVVSAPVTGGDGDHPRSRGVYSPGRDYLEGEIGSSPLARGLRAPLSFVDRLARIIPARAGFTHGRCVRRSNCMDHPRSRGVYRFSGLNIGDGSGSSPLARGLLGHKLSLN